MATRRTKLLLAIAAGVVAAAGLFLIGRVTASNNASPASRQTVGDYFDGLRIGEAQGRQLGRALQEADALPAADRRPVRDAFDAGYAAGQNDVFAGYDGGWTLHVPWVITIERGGAKVDYRIEGRTQLSPGVDYYLCRGGHALCSHPHQR
jgi:hypothetical protein